MFTFKDKDFEIMDLVLYELFGDVYYFIIDTIIEDFQIYEIYNNKFEKIGIIEKNKDTYSLLLFGNSIDYLKADSEKRILFEKLLNYFKYKVYLDNENYSKIYKDYREELDNAILDY